MPRTRGYEPEEVLDRAMAVFWKHGYRGATLEALVKSTGAPRYGFYTLYKGKREIFLKVLERYMAQVINPNLDRLSSPSAGLPELRAFFSAYRPMLSDPKKSRYGCLLCNTAVEAASVDAKIARVVDGLLTDVSRRFESALAGAERSGWHVPGGKPSGFADFLTGSLLGLMNYAHSPAPRRSVLNQLDGILAVLE